LYLRFYSPTLKVPKGDVIDAALYINPYRDDQFETPQVFQCYWQHRCIIERSQTPWKLLYNSKTKILLRLTVENPCDKNKKLAVNVFIAEDCPKPEIRIKDQYYALYEARLERLAETFHSLTKEIEEYYGKPMNQSRSSKGRGSRKEPKPTLKKERPKSESQSQSATKISMPVKLKRTEKRSRLSKSHQLARLESLMHKHKTRSVVLDNIEQLLTFAVRTGMYNSRIILYE